jgi:hypothetical protein
MHELAFLKRTAIGRTETPADQPDIEDTANKLRGYARRLNAASWKLDTAMSMLRKAKSGYRANPLLGDQAWEVAEYENRVRVAREEAETIIAQVERCFA